jgi:4-hydroxybenzoate polyprenyltransferase
LPESLRPLRLDHWHKNGFVLLGVVAALKTAHPPLTAHTVGAVLMSLMAACLMSSTNYAINEILDAPSDRHHPTKCTRPLAVGTVSVSSVVALAAICAIVSLALAWAVHPLLVATDVVFFFSGLTYNVPPVRAKDVPFVDVLVESANNPIRLGFGWFAVRQGWPPLSLVVAFWAIGALLMTSKRFSEFRDAGGRSFIVRYRKSFAGYTEESLHIAMVLYACLFAFSYGLLTQQYAPRLTLMFPGVLVFLGWWFALCYEAGSIVQEPERLLTRPWFALYCCAMFGLLVVLV